MTQQRQPIYIDLGSLCYDEVTEQFYIGLEGDTNECQSQESTTVQTD